MIKKQKLGKKIMKICKICKKEYKGTGKTGFCVSCAKKGKLNPNFKHDKTNNNKCEDCGVHISLLATRCNSCAQNYKYKDNKKIIKYCDKCNKILSRSNRSGLCGHCAQIGRILSKEWRENIKKAIQKYGNPFLGKHHTEETKLKMSKNHADFSEDKNPNWQNGIDDDPYSSEFKKIREQIRKRDNYTCQNCGMTEEEHLIVIGTNLPIHHIDYTKQNCKENNLITLCNSCNVRANYNRDYWKKLYTYKITLLKELNNE